MPHRVCPKCGFYKGREVITVKDGAVAVDGGGNRSGDETHDDQCRIALDAMGGDHAPAAIIKGALAAADQSVHIILVGQEAVVREHLARLTPTIRRTSRSSMPAQVMRGRHRDAPLLRKKRNSSIRICANLVHEGKADVMVSAGHTGAAMTSAYKVLGMIEGVVRRSPQSFRARNTRSCSTSGPMSIRSRRTCASSRSWATSTRRWSSGSRSRASAFSRSVKKKGRATS